MDYVCNHADYFIGLDQTRRGPLSDVTQPWEFLYPDSHRLDFSEGEQFDASDSRFAEPGIYILASGTLGKNIFTMPVTEYVGGSALPPVFVDFPKNLVNRLGTYNVRTPTATLVHIQDAAFSRWGYEMLDRVISHISRALAQTFQYDIFISFALEDYKLAVEIKAVLEAKGMTVYLDAVTPGKGFTQRLAGAIASSLLFVALNTHLLERKQRMGEVTWVEREVAFRKGVFLQESALLPLRVGGSQIADFLAGISYIDISPTFEPSFASEIRSIIDNFKEGHVVLPSAQFPVDIKLFTG